MHKIYKRKKNQIGFDFLHFDRKYDECEKKRPSLRRSLLCLCITSDQILQYSSQVNYKYCSYVSSITSCSIASDDQFRQTLSDCVDFSADAQDAAGENHAGRDLQRPVWDGGCGQLVVQTPVSAAQFVQQRVHHDAGAETGGAAASQRGEEVKTTHSISNRLHLYDISHPGSQTRLKPSP